MTQPILLTTNRVVFDWTKTYRYFLSRENLNLHLNPKLQTCLFIMLNPSTADADVDDPTIRRCMSFAKLWGYCRLEVVNLFALRSPNPGVLRRHPNPIGDDNDQEIRGRARDANLIVAAWGAHGSLANRDNHVLSLIQPIFQHSLPITEKGLPVFCLGTTKGGHPRHPLYVKANTQLIPYEGRSRL